MQIASQYKETAQLDTEKGMARIGSASKKKEQEEQISYLYCLFLCNKTIIIIIIYKLNLNTFCLNYHIRYEIYPKGSYISIHYVFYNLQTI
jgi:hypothetical protein